MKSCFPRLRPTAGVTVLLALLAASVSASHRQVPMVDYVQEVWEAREGGLPHPTVTSIYHSRAGYLWIGTYAGLVRFDGLTFQAPADLGPGEVLLDHVRDIAEGGDGSLWIGTRHKGVARIKDGAVRVFDAAQGFMGTTTILTAARDGTAWVASDPLRSISPSGDVRRYGEAEGLPGAAVSALLSEADGTLWVGTPQGQLSWFDGTRFHPVKWQDEGPPPAITSLTRDRAGHLWVGTATGLFELAGERTADVSAHRRLDQAVTSVSSGQRGVWARTARGVVRVTADGVRSYGTSEGLLSEVTMALAQDDQGGVWVGTRIGMIRMRPRIMHSYSRAEGLPSKAVMSVLESRRGDLWVGTMGGLARRTGATWTTFGRAEGLPDVAVRALAEDAHGTIWIGTADGLARYSEGRITSIPAPDRPYVIRSLAVDRANRVWIGTYDQGIDRLENGRTTRVLRRADTCAQSWPLFLFPGAGDDMWVGGSAALLRQRAGRFDCIRNTQEPTRDDIRSIVAADAGVLWLATIGGLARVDARGQVEALPGGRAPFDTPTYAVLDDGRGSLWISTPRGLFQIRKDDLERAKGAAPARGFGVGDGLASSVMTGDGQPSAWRGSDGRLYFASADGLAVVDPAVIEAMPAPPPVYVESVLADGRPLRDLQEVPAGTIDIDVHYAAVSFNVPELVRYRYRLEGFDADWQEAQNRRVASYTNLRPGPYRFRVMAADHSGVWSEGTVHDFRLAPLLHQTTWFRALLAAAVVALVLGAHRYRLARLHAEAAALQREVDQSLANIQILRGLLPICAWCRRVRQDSGYWQQLDVYVMERSDARFTQSLCADCAALEESERAREEASAS